MAEKFGMNQQNRKELHSVFRYIVIYYLQKDIEGNNSLYANDFQSIIKE